MKSGKLLAVLGLTLALAVVKTDAVRAQSGDDSPGEARVGPALAPGHVAVYLVPYLKSHSGTPEPSATVISLSNVGGVTACPTSVDWKVGFGGTACTTTLTLAGGLPVGDTGEHCSRGVPGDVATCNATCVAGLGFIEGKAVVGTTPACVNRIAVDARLYYFGAGDVPTHAATDLKVIRLPLGNKGD